MTVVDDPAGDVQMGNGVAVEQQLLLGVVIQQRRDGNRRQHHGEARLVALLRVTLLETRTITACSLQSDFSFRNTASSVA